MWRGEYKLANLCRIKLIISFLSIVNVLMSMLVYTFYVFHITRATQSHDLSGEVILWIIYTVHSIRLHGDMEDLVSRMTGKL